MVRQKKKKKKKRTINGYSSAARVDVDILYSKQIYI